MSARGSIAALFLVLAAGRAEAAAIARCSDAFVFPGARVNVVVLPYDYAVPMHDSTGDTGQGLSLLVQMNTLSAILKYEKVGAIELVRPRPHDHSCDPETVWERITSMAKTNRNGVVMVWGRIFEDGAQIYEQTFVRFVRGDTPAETWKVRAHDRAFDAALSAQEAAFPAQTFSSDDLQEVARLISKDAVLRERPDDNAPGEPLGPDLAKCIGCTQGGHPFSYFITEQKGAWEHISGSGKQGWLKLDTGFGSGPLATKMPEMFFVEGVVGFLQSRMTESAAFARFADEALAAYARNTAGMEPASTAVLTGEMRALMAAARGDAEGAVSLLDSALRNSPADAQALNLLAVAKLNRWTATKKPESQAQLIQAFVSASVLDPAGSRALSNLKTFLEIAGDPALASWPEHLSGDDAKAQLALVNSILAKRAAPTDR